MFAAVPPLIVPTFAVVSLVDPAQAHLGDRARRGGDRRPPFLRVHPGVCGAAVEHDGQVVGRGGAEDDLADRRRLVVDVADPRPQAAVVEGVGAEQPDLLLRREEQLDARMRPVLGEHAARRLEHRGDGGLVVAAEDRRSGVADDPVLDDRLELVGRRHRVEMGAEEHRLAVGRGLEGDVDVAHRRADARPGLVLVGPQAAVPEVGGHTVGDLPLLAGRARDACELDEQVKHFGRHRVPSYARARRATRSARPAGGAVRASARVRRRRTRGRAAPAGSGAT